MEGGCGPVLQSSGLPPAQQVPQRLSRPQPRAQRELLHCRGIAGCNYALIASTGIFIRSYRESSRLQHSNRLEAPCRAEGEGSALAPPVGLARAFEPARILARNGVSGTHARLHRATLPAGGPLQRLVQIRLRPESLGPSGLALCALAAQH